MQCDHQAAWFTTGLDTETFKEGIELILTKVLFFVQYAEKITL